MRVTESSGDDTDAHQWPIGPIFDIRQAIARSEWMANVTQNTLLSNVSGRRKQTLDVPGLYSAVPRSIVFNIFMQCVDISQSHDW